MTYFGGPPENRTLINWLKANYTAIVLTAHILITSPLFYWWPGGELNSLRRWASTNRSTGELHSP